MKSVALYRPNHTWVHRLFDPFSKLVYFFCAMVCAFFVPNVSGALVMFAVHLLLLACGKELSRALKTIVSSLFLLFTVFLIQGMLNPHNETILWTLGPIHLYQEGLSFALTIALRVVNILAASSVLVLTTSPAAVMDACVRRGLSPKVGYVFTAILQMIPVMMNSAQTIREAQQSRGMSLKGNVIQRVRAFLPLMGPVVLSAFLSIQDKAMALEVRGFSVQGKRTFYRTEEVSSYMVWMRAGMVVITVLVISWGVRS